MKGGKLLDIGCGTKPYRALFEPLGIHYEGIDFKAHSVNPVGEFLEPDYLFDDTYVKDFKLVRFKDESYDLIASFQVLEHHPYPEIFFQEVARILKSRGHLILTFPLIWGLHEEPRDYFRFTEYKIREWCKRYNLEVIEKVKRGNTLTLLSLIMSQSIIGWPRLIRWPLWILLFLPFQMGVWCIDRLFLRNNRTGKWFLGYAYLIQKK